MKSKPSIQALVYCLFFIIAGAYLIMAFFFPMGYILGTYEDLFGEWLQFWFFVITFFYTLKIAISAKRFRLFFGFLAVCCFYVAMEEISWGQRILKIPTTEFFKTHNIQKEMNFHNLLTGPVDTPLKAGIEYALSAALLLYGVIYPLVLRHSRPIGRRFESLGLPAPPLYLWPFFMTGAILELGFFHFNEAEVAELLISFSLSLFAMHYWTSHRMAFTSGDNHPAQEKLSAARTVHTAAIAFGAICLTLATTAIIHASPDHRGKVERRIMNGVEKFAGRYTRYQNWDKAVELYLKVHAKEPARNSIMRKLANCYKQMGDDSRFRYYNGKVLRKDLKVFEKKPDKISLNHSLARTYRQRGDTERAEYHLERALRAALTRVDRKPESASAAYWLGKTYMLRGTRDKALQSFKRALDLKPSSTKYRKAYFRTAAL